jgi:hypothetical protein
MSSIPVRNPGAYFLYLHLFQSGTYSEAQKEKDQMVGFFLLKQSNPITEKMIKH